VGRAKAKDEIQQSIAGKGNDDLYTKILTEVIQSQLMPDCDSVLLLIIPRVIVI